MRVDFSVYLNGFLAFKYLKIWGFNLSFHINCIFKTVESGGVTLKNILGKMFFSDH